MGIFRLLFAVGIAVSPVLASMAPAVLGQQRVELPPTDDDFKEQMKRLQRKNSVPGRLEAVKWLDHHSEAKNAHLAIPALEQCIRADPEARVRVAAVECLASIAKKRQAPYPLVIVEAMLDKDESVRQSADGLALALEFKSYAPGSVEALLRCAKSENARVRGNCLFHLARAGGKDKAVLAAIEKAKQDKSFGIRHNAHCALFQANDNLGEFLAYLIRLQEDPDGVLGQVDTNSEAGKLELTTRNLAQIGSAVLIIEWSDKRADDLAPALLKLLRSPSPIMRRGAARLVGASAVKIDLADWTLGNSDGKKLLDPAQEVVKPKKRPQKSKVAIQLERAKVEDCLRELRDNDADPTVRNAAGIALERFTSVQHKERNGR